MYWIIIYFACNNETLPELSMYDTLKYSKLFSVTVYFRNITAVFTFTMKTIQSHFHLFQGFSGDICKPDGIAWWLV